MIDLAGSTFLFARIHHAVRRIFADANVRQSKNALVEKFVVAVQDV